MRFLSEGPRIVFFSGGTALAPVAAALTRHTRTAVHVITTFDSGGSSAELRRVFSMPAVGDVRARILALADSGLPGHAEITALFAYRLPLEAGDAELRRELTSLAAGIHPLAVAVPRPLRDTAVRHLSAFCEMMPETMNLAGASIGNLALTAGYMEHARQLEPVATLFSRLVHARGVVKPVVNACAHLCVELENGDVVVGQHRFTGKTASAIASPIRRLWLSGSLDDPRPVSVGIRPRLEEVIRSADLICYPVGSFFSSVMANLLPEGVSRAVRAAACPRVFIPNLGNDPELFGLSVQDQVAYLLRLAGAEDEPARALNWLLVDSDDGRYPGGIPDFWLRKHGIRVRRTDLVVRPPYLDADRVCRELMLLAGRRP